jgi:hypothetical protein
MTDPDGDIKSNPSRTRGSCYAGFLSQSSVNKHDNVCQESDAFAQTVGLLLVRLVAGRSAIEERS